MVTLNKTRGKKDNSMANFLKVSEQIEGAAKIVSEGGTEGGSLLKSRHINDKGIGSSCGNGGGSNSTSHSPSGGKINLDKRSTTGSLKIRKKPPI